MQKKKKVRKKGDVNKTIREMAKILVKVHFLCIEHGEQFIIEAESLEQAKEDASLYGGEVIRQLTKKEEEQIKRG